MEYFSSRQKAGKSRGILIEMGEWMTIHTEDQVFIHNHAYSSESAARNEFANLKRDHADLTYWNLWQKKAIGWDLEEGEPILLVASWPTTLGVHHQIMARVVVNNVMHCEHINWTDAVKKLMKWSGRSRKDVVSNPYTAAKMDSEKPLNLLAYRIGRVKIYDQPLPGTVVINRNGWGRVLASVLDIQIPRDVQRHRGGKRSTAGGQGRLDKVSRDAVENRAMDVAEAWCESQGWKQVKDTSRKQPWDFEAKNQEGQTRYIEVKGSTGTKQKFDVTIGEVNAAARHGDSHCLVAVTSIKLSQSDSGNIIGTGGRIEVYDPWRPRKGELKETRYTWEPKS